MSGKHYFVLSGSNEHLALSELKALMETTGHGRIIKCYTMLCIVEDLSYNDVVYIVHRAGQIKEAGVYIGETSLYDKPLDIDFSQYRSIRTVRLKPINPSGQALSYAGKIKRLASNNGTKGERMLRLIFTEGIAVYGEPIVYLDTRSFYERRPSARPFFRSIALSVALARTMINLARVREGARILDPFAGTGSILIEAGLMGMIPVGIEIDWKLIHGSKANLEEYGINALLILGDSTEIKLADMDAIVTDPPYGRAASTKRRDPLGIYELFIQNSWELLRRKRYMVFLSPHYYTKNIDEILCENGFIIREKTYLYVHGGLTRVLYVVLKP